MVNSAAHDNRTTLRKLLVVSCVMFGFGFAMVPFYKKFCDVTGINNVAKADVVSNTQVDAARWHTYAAVQWVPIAVTVTGMLLFAHDAPTSMLAALAVGVLVSLGALAGLLESRPWAFSVEVARQFGLIALAGVAALTFHPPCMLLGLWAVASLPFLATRASPPSSPAAAA